MNNPRSWLRSFILPALWVETVLTLLVISGGAFVRATGSGAGCGEHWPLCNGEAIPVNPRIETIIEFTHRITSGSSLLLFVVLYFILRSVLPRDHASRAWAKVALVSFFLEAAIGALLVLKKLVAGDTSYFRAVVIALHLVNTYVLMAGLMGVLWNWRLKPRLRPGQITPLWVAVFAGWCLVGAMGAVVALGDTLFPSATLLGGLQQDLAVGTNPLVKLRVLHPLIATAVAMVTLWLTLPGSATQEQNPRACAWVRNLILLQIACGLANWAWLAPLWLQITHLLLADLTWLAVVWLGFSASTSEFLPELGLPHPNLTA